MSAISWILTAIVVVFAVTFAWVLVRMDKLKSGKLTGQNVRFMCVIVLLLFGGPFIEWWLS